MAELQKELSPLAMSLKPVIYFQINIQLLILIIWLNFY